MNIDYSRSRKYLAKCSLIIFIILELIIATLDISHAGSEYSLDTFIKGSFAIVLIALIIYIRLGFYKNFKFDPDKIIINKMFWGMTYTVKSISYQDIEYFYDYVKSEKVINSYLKLKLKKYPYSITILLQSSFSQNYGRFVNNKGKVKALLVSKGVKYLSKKERELIWD